MAEKHLAAAFLIAFITAGFSKVVEIQAETIDVKFSSEPSRPFNPFSMSSWLSLPSQFAKYWFPFFQQPYYPSYLQKPATTTTTTTTTTPSPVAKNTTETPTGNSKPTSVNIFGISGPPDEELEYLPEGENKIEWYMATVTN